MNCVHCGHELPQGASCCPACTAVQPKNPSAKENVSVKAPAAAASPYSHIAPAAVSAAPVSVSEAPSASVPAASSASTAPIGMGGYLGIIILMFIPIINIVFALLWSFSDKANVNRRNLSRAFLVVMGVGLFLAIIALAVLVILLITNPEFNLSF